MALFSQPSGIQDLETLGHLCLAHKWQFGGMVCLFLFIPHLGATSGRVAIHHHSSCSSLSRDLEAPANLFRVVTLKVGASDTVCLLDSLTCVKEGMVPRKEVWGTGIRGQEGSAGADSRDSFLASQGSLLPPAVPSSWLCPQGVLWEAEGIS